MNLKNIEFTKKSSATLQFFLSDKNQKSPFILVVPGGGYDHFGSKEQDSIAEFFNSKGFSGAVLRYSISPMKFPQPLSDLADAVEYLRDNAESLKISSNKICVLGFSAGGHLSACLGSFWNNKNLLSNAGKKIRPDFLCLCYPVISADKSICHEGSFLRLTENLSEEEGAAICNACNSENLRDALSIEKHISSDFPPAFIWHTRQDQAVPSANTIELTKALQNTGCDFEYHLFGEGPHGLALAENTSAEIWTDLFINWLKSKENK